MTRATQTISIALLASSTYLLLALPLLTDSSPIPSILPTKIQVEIIPVLPFWALITLAAYLLGRLGWGVLMFNDTEEAYNELMSQIDQAKKDLDKRKVAWD
ncbi:hypothetical protein LTR70_006687 [Exophiala xenobiotica]|uniref:Dolichol-phosphate mannosyltransferase subunit 3 n=1 Tax=Lithohypha guttulata TaxID=1690604 RepID=A0ABR0K6K6_9EURO|nr:hypothetical protein LTR24_006235 [Lithohypha guttulata]KAK5315603.1 hypothetical protein LTR70_006687 [Exophiala xenobiotica]